ERVGPVVHGRAGRGDSLGPCRAAVVLQRPELWVGDDGADIRPADSPGRRHPVQAVNRVENAGRAGEADHVVRGRGAGGGVVGDERTFHQFGSGGRGGQEQAATDSIAEIVGDGAVLQGKGGKGQVQAAAVTGDISGNRAVAHL